MRQQIATQRRTQDGQNAANAQFEHGAALRPINPIDDRRTMVAPHAEKSRVSDLHGQIQQSLLAGAEQIELFQAGNAKTQRIRSETVELRARILPNNANLGQADEIEMHVAGRHAGPRRDVA